MHAVAGGVERDKRTLLRWCSVERREMSGSYLTDASQVYWRVVCRSAVSLVTMARA